MILQTVNAVNAEDMPEEVEAWCEGHDFYDTGLYCVNDDGNSLAEWLKSLGMEFPEKGWDWIGVWK